MNLTEAKEIMRLVRDGAAQQELSDDKLALMAEHLAPLPFEWVRQKVRFWMVSPNLDPQGHERPKFVSDVDSFLDACGVPIAARADLARAVEARKRHEMAEMMCDLRAFGELTYVGPNDPLPQGVCEAILVAGKELPPGRATAALPPPRSSGPPADVQNRMRDLATRFQTGARAVVAVQERRTPEIPAELQPAYDKLQAAVRSAEISKQSHAANADEYRRRIEELVDELSPDDMPIEAVRPAAVRLLKRLVEHGGAVAAAEAVGDVWGLSATALDLAPKDRFEDEPPTRIRLVLEKAS